MATVTVTLSETAAERLSKLVSARGVSTDEAVSDLVLAAPVAASPIDDARTAFQSFFGCGTGKAKGPTRSIAELRRDLAGRKLAGGTENI